MYHYRLYGGLLRSEVQLPELPTAEGGRADWVLTRTPRPVCASGELLGSDSVTGDVEVRLFRSEAGYQLVFDDTGRFDISPDGSEIVWSGGENAPLADVRVDITSRVMAAALHATGRLCLHGSGVSMDGVAIGLIAPKGFGKSTLALALVHSGARLLTDDTLPVDPGPPTIAQPGLHATRLRADSASRVALGVPQSARVGEKLLYGSLPADAITDEGAPLDALYVLSPARTSPDGRVVWRTRLSTVESAMVIIGNAKLASLLGGPATPELFRAGGALAQRVPVYRLHVVRDFDRLGEVAETLRSWHAGAAAPTPAPVHA